MFLVLLVVKSLGHLGWFYQLNMFFPKGFLVILILD